MIMTHYFSQFEFNLCNKYFIIYYSIIVGVLNNRTSVVSHPSPSLAEPIRILINPRKRQSVSGRGVEEAESVVGEMELNPYTALLILLVVSTAVSATPHTLSRGPSLLGIHLLLGAC